MNSSDNMASCVGAGGSGWGYIVQLADGGSSMDGNTTCGIAMTGLGLAAISCCFYAAVCLESAVVTSLL